jgi:hypothetical protein
VGGHSRGDNRLNRTNILQWPFPAYRDKSWYGIFEEMMTGISTDLFSVIEDANFVIYGGGTIVLNPTTNEVSWSDDIGIFSMISWGKAAVPAGSITGVTDGKIICISVSRPIDTITSATMNVVDSMDSLRTKTFFAKRVGDNLVMHSRYHSVLIGT